MPRRCGRWPPRRLRPVACRGYGRKRGRCGIMRKKLLMHNYLTFNGARVRWRVDSGNELVKRCSSGDRGCGWVGRRTGARVQAGSRELPQHPPAGSAAPEGAPAGRCRGLGRPARPAPGPGIRHQVLDRRVGAAVRGRRPADPRSRCHGPAGRSGRGRVLPAAAAERAAGVRVRGRSGLAPAAGPDAAQRPGAPARPDRVAGDHPGRAAGPAGSAPPGRGTAGTRALATGHRLADGAGRAGLGQPPVAGRPGAHGDRRRGGMPAAGQRRRAVRLHGVLAPARPGPERAGHPGPAAVAAPGQLPRGHRPLPRRVRGVDR